MYVEFVGQSVQDPSNIIGDPSRLVNCYREPAGDGVSWLKSVPAMEPFADMDRALIPAMLNKRDAVYVVCGGRLFRVNKTSGAETDIGLLAPGRATMAGQLGYVMVQAGTRYFVHDTEGSGIIEPTPGDFSSFGSVEYFSNYTILTQAGGNGFQWSEPGDPTTLPVLNTSRADGREDYCVRAFAIHGRLYIFKEWSHEIWYATGQAGSSAFERIAGGVIDVGLALPDLICRFDNGAFMVGSDGRVSIITPGGLQPISTPALETVLRRETPVKCVVYGHEGHLFLCVIFKNYPAWCYDVATGEWHERAYNEGLEPWPVSATAQVDRKRWIAASDNGKIYNLTGFLDDDGVKLVREATSKTMELDGARVPVREFELKALQGVMGDWTIRLSMSRDGGMTWGLEKPKKLSQFGNFGQRVIWRNLGQFRQANAKLRWTDSGDMTISTKARIRT